MTGKSVPFGNNVRAYKVTGISCFFTISLYPILYIYMLKNTMSCSWAGANKI